MRPDHERHDDGFFVLRVGVQSAASAPRARRFQKALSHTPRP